MPPIDSYNTYIPNEIFDDIIPKIKPKISFLLFGIIRFTIGELVGELVLSKEEMLEMAQSSVSTAKRSLRVLQDMDLIRCSRVKDNGFRIILGPLMLHFIREREGSYEGWKRICVLPETENSV